MDNNTKLERITNFILQNNNNEFSIQAFIKKIILEGIDFTDDNIVYLAEKFNGVIDVETFVLMGKIYKEIKDSDISLNKDNIDEEIDEIIKYIFFYRDSGYELNGVIPKIIAIKHYIRNKKINGTFDKNPLYNRIVIINDNVLIKELPKQIELSKQTNNFYFIHRNKKRNGSFFIIHKGKYVYIDSACNEYTPPQNNQTLQDAFLGSQNIGIQSKSGCRIYTGLGMAILDEYIKKYKIENLEELGKQVQVSEDGLNHLFSIKQDKIRFLNNIRKELRDLEGELVKEEEIKRKEYLTQKEEQTIVDIKTFLQNTINQEKEENKDNISLTEQSLLKLLQLIDPTKESIDMEKDCNDIILLFNRVSLDIKKVFSLTHILFPLAQTMSLVNSYIDHNEQLKEADTKIKDIKDNIKVNHFVSDFREDILSRFDKIEELSERIDSQKLQNIKFLETPVEKLSINEEKEQQDKTTLEKQYPDFIYQHGNENIVVLLETIMNSKEMFEKYTEIESNATQKINI